MRLYIYRGFENEFAPKNVSHAIIDDSVTIIKQHAFLECRNLVSVIMGDNVKKIEKWAFLYCFNLKYIRLSKTLEYIGDANFERCARLEAVFLPSTVRFLGDHVFVDCKSLRLLVLPANISQSNIGEAIIGGSCLHYIGAQYFGVEYVGHECQEEDYHFSPESNEAVNRWLMTIMYFSPLHKLCYDSSVTALKIQNFLLNNNGNDRARHISMIDGKTPLHILIMNPHAPADAILALLKANINAVDARDNQYKTPIQYAAIYNPAAFVGIYCYFHEHKIESRLESLLDYYDDERERVPLHILAMNPFTPANAMAGLLNLEMEAVFCEDAFERMTPLDYARECNVGGLIAMINLLCNHRNTSMALVEKQRAVFKSKKRKSEECWQGSRSMRVSQARKTSQHFLADWLFEMTQDEKRIKTCIQSMHKMDLAKEGRYLLNNLLAMQEVMIQDELRMKTCIQSMQNMNFAKEGRSLLNTLLAMQEVMVQDEMRMKTCIQSMQHIDFAKEGRSLLNALLTM